MRTLKSSCAALLVSLFAASHAVAAPGDLKVIAIDAEGGASVLYITPDGHSMLVDAGWAARPGGPGRTPDAPPRPATPATADAVLAALKANGLTKLDYLVMSHFHIDHLSGVPALAAAVPIGAFIDHGPNRELALEGPAGGPPGATGNEAYRATIAGKTHIVMKAGQTLKLGQMTFTAINGDRDIVDHRLGPAVPADPGCDHLTYKADDGGEENVRSLGLLIQWGQTRILTLGDTTWDFEAKLVCPLNRIGPVDLMMSSNHGSDASNSPVLLNSVKPRVVIVNNGSQKGGDGAVLERFVNLPSRPAVWQVHYATRSPDKNVAEDQIANLNGPDKVYPLVVTLNQTGGITVQNPRNGFTRTYARGAK